MNETNTTSPVSLAIMNNNAMTTTATAATSYPTITTTIHHQQHHHHQIPHFSVNDLDEATTNPASELTTTTGVKPSSFSSSSTSSLEQFCSSVSPTNTNLSNIAAYFPTSSQQQFQPNMSFYQQPNQSIQPSFSQLAISSSSSSSYQPQTNLPTSDNYSIGYSSHLGGGHSQQHQQQPHHMLHNHHLNHHHNHHQLQHSAQISHHHVAPITHHQYHNQLSIYSGYQPTTQLQQPFGIKKGK